MSKGWIWWVAALLLDVGFSVFGIVYIRRRLGSDHWRLLPGYIGLCAVTLCAGLLWRAPSETTVGYYGMLPLLMLIAAEDIERHRISNKLLAVLLVVGLAFVLANRERLLSRLAALVIYGGVFILVSLITRGKFGMGDAKLCGVVGLFFGLIEMFTVLFLASLLACACGLAVAIKTRDLKREIPFAPPMTLAVLVTLVGGWF